MHSPQSGFVAGRHFTEWVPDVHMMKKAGDLEGAARLLLTLVDAVEAQAAVEHGKPDPWYYEELARIYEKRLDYSSAVAILERLVRANCGLFGEFKAYSPQSGFVDGRHFTAWVPDVHQMKKAGDLEGAARLLLTLVDAVEAQAAAEHGPPAPWYYEELARIYRKRLDYDSEVAILERLANHSWFHGRPSPADARLRRAKHLRGGGSYQRSKPQREREMALHRSERIGCTEAAFETEEHALRNRLGVALPRDVFLSLSNQAVMKSTAGRDWLKLSSVHREVAEYLRDEGNSDWANHKRLAWLATSQWLLTFEPPQTPYRLSACTCAVCSQDDGLRLLLGEVAIDPRIPHPGCEKGFCKCAWFTVREPANEKRAQVPTLFAWYDAWKTTPLTCERCGWCGTFEKGDVYYHDQLMESTCPRCGFDEAPMLAAVSFPTKEETKERWPELSPAEQASYLERKAFLDDWEGLRLRAPEQLPEIAGSEDLTLQWDLVEDGDTRHTVIRLHGVELWRELAVWEGYSRFRGMVIVLKQKYGPRLLDVVPTMSSELFLVGDFLGASERIAETRRLIQRI